MNRTPVSQRELPCYSLNEERVNMITHLVGAVFGVVVLIFAVMLSLSHHRLYGVVSAVMYGVSLISLYSVSAVYHGLPYCYGKKVMQVVDHCMIYFLIAGSYTPILFSSLMPLFPFLSWVLFGLEWGIALVAVVFTAIDLRRYEKLSLICYLLLGWMILLILKPVISAMTLPGFWWLLAGGIAYTFGAVLYVLGKRRKYFHSVFHVFVLIGSVLHAVCFLDYVF